MRRLIYGALAAAIIALALFLLLNGSFERKTDPPHAAGIGG